MQELTNYAEPYLGKEVTIKVDRPMGSVHPSHKFIYPINYGFVPNTIAPDGAEIDAYILGVFEPVQIFKGTCIAVIKRRNDNDDKLVIVPNGKVFSDDQIKALTEFQERFFQSVVVIAQ